MSIDVAPAGRGDASSFAFITNSSLSIPAFFGAYIATGLGSIIQKARSDTDLIVLMMPHFYTDTAQMVKFSLTRIGGSDTEIVRRFANETLQRKFSACVQKISGLAAGTYAFTFKGAPQTNGTTVTFDGPAPVFYVVLEALP